MNIKPGFIRGHQLRNKGFSLVGVLLAIGVTSALTLSLLQIADLTVQVKSLALESSEFQSRSFVAWRVLSDPLTCRLNFGLVDVSSANTRLSRPLMTRQGNTLDKELFPITAGGAGQVVGHFFSRIPNVDNLINYNIEFQSKMNSTTAIRTVPIAVLLNTDGKIAECSSDFSSLGSEAGDTGALAKLKAGACDESKLPSSARPTSGGYIVRGAMPLQPEPQKLESFCKLLSFPIPSAGAEITCSQLKSLVPNKINGGGGVLNSVDWLGGLIDRYSDDLVDPGGIFKDCTSSTPGKTVKISKLAGIQNLEECKQIPTSFSGAGLRITELGAIMGGLGGSSTKYVCIDGSWHKF